jgi:hypothetical protein
MSYEKVKIVGIRQVVKKKTGEVHSFLQVEHLQSYDIYLNDDAVKQIAAFEKIKGREALIPVSWGEYNGKPSMNLTDDFLPLPAPVRKES